MASITILEKYQSFIRTRIGQITIDECLFVARRSEDMAFKERVHFLMLAARVKKLDDLKGTYGYSKGFMQSMLKAVMQMGVDGLLPRLRKESDELRLEIERTVKKAPYYYDSEDEELHELLKKAIEWDVILLGFYLKSSARTVLNIVNKNHINIKDFVNE